jgi:hypothetical protein
MSYDAESVTLTRQLESSRSAWGSALRWACNSPSKRLTSGWWAIEPVAGLVIGGRRCLNSGVLEPACDWPNREEMRTQSAFATRSTVDRDTFFSPRST